METTETTTPGPTRASAIAWRERQIAHAPTWFRSDPGDDGMTADEKRAMWHGIIVTLRQEIHALSLLSEDASPRQVWAAVGCNDKGEPWTGYTIHVSSPARYGHAAHTKTAGVFRGTLREAQDYCRKENRYARDGRSRFAEEAPTFSVGIPLTRSEVADALDRLPELGS